MKDQFKPIAAALCLLLISAGCFSMGQSIAAKSFRSPQRLKEWRLSISFGEQSLHEAIETLSRFHHIPFSYNPNDLRKYRIKPCSFNDASLARILDVLLAATDLTISERDRSLIIHRKRMESRAILPGVGTEAGPPEATRQTAITGVVVDESSHPISDVTVSIKGMNRAVSTDPKGRFTIEATPGTTLVFSMVGFRTQEITADDGGDMMVTLRQALAALDEV